MKKNIESLIVKIIFSVLLIFLILQHYYVFMYFDDYGHASLSYGHVVSNVNGTNYNVKQLFEWSSFYYSEWGGRVIYYTLFLLPLLSKSISLFMFIQSIIFFFIFVYIYKIIQSYNPNFNPILTIISLITLYGLIPIEILKESAYWASASVCYTWSLLPLSMGIFYLMEVTKEDSVPTTSQVIFIPILFFFASCSFEQSGAASLVFVIFYFLVYKRKKMFLKVSLPTFFLTLFGVLIQYLAPGNNNRMNIMHPDFKSLSFIEKVKAGVPNIVNFIFNPKISIFIFILCLLCISTIIIFLSNNNKYKYLLTFPIVVPVFYLIKSYYNLESSTSLKLLLLIIIFYYFLLAIYPKRDFIPILLVVAASIFCLILSPVLQLRSLIFFLILLFIPIVINLNRFFIFINKNNKFLLIAILSVFFAFSLINYKNIFLGYKANYSYALENHKKLSSLSGQKNLSGKIKLYKYPYDFYRDHMPYDPETPYIQTWMKEFYDLPENTEFKWENP